MTSQKLTSLDITLLTMIMCYPTLFQNRDEALNHLFVVLGNGYEWEKGILVEYGGSKPIKPGGSLIRIAKELYSLQGKARTSFVKMEFENKQNQRNHILRRSKEKGKEACVDLLWDFFEWECRTTLPPFEEALVRMQTWPSDPSEMKRPYPFSSLTEEEIPDDIQDDHLTGLVEYLTWVVHHYQHTPNPREGRMAPWEQEHLRYTEFLSRISGRFEDRLKGKKVFVGAPWTTLTST